MTAQSPTLMRCERCRALVSTAEATEMIRNGVPCGVCGGTLKVCDGRRRTRWGADRDHRSCTSAELRLLDILREADGRPVGPTALARAGIDDPTDAIFGLERAGYPIERTYADVSTGQRRFLGYRLRSASGRQASASRGTRLR
jgi:hypothetical protein